jgi:protein-disulfide isomerase
MNLIKRFKSLPISARRQLSLGIVIAFTVALPLFVWAIVSQKFLINQKAQEVQRVTVSTDGAPYFGPLDAPITILEFSDFQCSFCKSFHDVTLQPLLQAYPNQIRFVVRNFPLLASHPDSENAAEAALCANEQDMYWQMSDLLFANQDNLTIANLKTLAATLDINLPQFNSCLDTLKYSATIQQDIVDGTSYGLVATPTFFINGIPVMGAQPLSAFQQIIDQELNPEPSPTESPTASPSATPTETPTMSPTASPTESPTGTPTPTPTPTPETVGTPNPCGGTCGSHYNCQSGLFCNQGFCRNPFCPSDPKCTCLISNASPTPTPVVSKIKTTPLPQPTEKPFEWTTVNLSSPTPTGSRIAQVSPKTNMNFLLWFAGGSFSTAILLLLLAL